MKAQMELENLRDFQIYIYCMCFVFIYVLLLTWKVNTCQWKGVTLLHDLYSLKMSWKAFSLNILFFGKYRSCIWVNLSLGWRRNCSSVTPIWLLPSCITSLIIYQLFNYIQTHVRPNKLKSLSDIPVDMLSSSSNHSFDKCFLYAKCWKLTAHKRS